MPAALETGRHPETAIDAHVTIVGQTELDRLTAYLQSLDAEKAALTAKIRQIRQMLKRNRQPLSPGDETAYTFAMEDINRRYNPAAKIVKCLSEGQGVTIEPVTIEPVVKFGKKLRVIHAQNDNGNNGIKMKPIMFESLLTVLYPEPLPKDQCGSAHPRVQIQMALNRGQMVVLKPDPVLTTNK